MSETLDHNEMRLKLSKKLFSELLMRRHNYSPNVQDNLSSSLKKCEEKLKKISKYARMWSTDTKPKGETINKERYNDLLKRKENYDIFVIDQGEYISKSIGDVYFCNIPRPPQFKSKKTKNINNKNELSDKCYNMVLTPLEYRILVFTLEKYCVPGDVLNFVENCWFEKSLANDLREVLIRESKGIVQHPNFHERTNKFRKGIGQVSKLLIYYFGIELRTSETGKYKLEPFPTFCLIKKL